MLAVFSSTFVSSGLGMGYPAFLSPVLLLAGYEPAVIVSVLMAGQVSTDIVAACFHQREGNVDLRGGRDLRLGIFLSGLGYVGMAAVLFCPLNISQMKYYTPVLVLLFGSLVLFTIKKPMFFSAFGVLLASLLTLFDPNKGGFSPLLVGGLLLVGINSKSVVGIVVFSRALLYLPYLLAWAVFGKTWSPDARLILIVVLCSLPASVLASKLVRRADELRLRFWIGVLLTVLGAAAWMLVKKGLPALPLL